ncbi:hypothetical protein BST97_00315 [Nonlabens spongiae]|uniref:Shikimate kinase n=1 Tax=Nonlabens spongiae TaxID=331648 RepID=A0A1W6MGG5_9FLAO|nr:shikimate kinase [Nonlabens spongiae]ARN76569.1 hypothetical protein BST97_00315 [Nonlabens spongiae]
MSNLVVLVGYMGSGKSSVGRKLAVKMDLPFIDLDDLIEQVEGKSISEIFEKQGVLHFRKLEREVLENTLRENLNAVIAVGGGTPCYYNNMDMINEHGLSIYLRANVPQLSRRLFPERMQRPIIESQQSLESLQEFIGKHLFERSPFYERAHETLDVGLIDLDEVVQHCEHIINQRKTAE